MRDEKTVHPSSLLLVLSSLVPYPSSFIPDMNPIIRRELLEVLRRRRAVALQIGLAVACALLVLVRWPTGDVIDLNGARSQGVLRVFGYGLLAAVLLLVPAFPATSLVREKVKGTLALLLNSPMRPGSIYLGKLGGVLGFTAVRLVMTLPAAAACHALGGTGTSGGVTMLYLVLGMAAVQLSTLALLVSSRSQSTVGALRGSYALVLLVSVAVLGPYWMLHGRSDPVTEAAGWLRCLSPIPAVTEILGQRDAGAQGIAVSDSAVVRYLLLAALSSIVCAVATVARLNHRLLDRSRAAGLMTEDRSRGGRAARRMLFLVDPQRRSGSMSLWINPVLVKEFRSRRFGRSHWMLRIIALCGIASLGLSYLAASGAPGVGVEYTGGILVFLQVALLILFAPSLASGLISAERESGTWQLLRMTPLTPGAILRAKLLSVAWPLLLFCVRLCLATWC
jgi:ABC-type transport system involved in multi-copper enzyme maturation permease subunit